MGEQDEDTGVTMEYKLPNDPNILFSYMNMMLRDRYPSLEEFCIFNDADLNGIK